MRSTSIIEQKAALRASVRAVLTAMGPEERTRSDAGLFRQFLALPEVEAAGTVLLFHGAGPEPDTAALIPALLKRGKRAALPRCLPGRAMEARLVARDTVLVRHPYGMLEPGVDCPVADKGSLDLILVPGVCFDAFGYRLGQGGGYYDRYLADFSGFTVGLCRAAVLQTAVPREDHDSRVDAVVTEEGVLRPGRDGALNRQPRGG